MYSLQKKSDKPTSKKSRNLSNVGDGVNCTMWKLWCRTDELQRHKQTSHSQHQIILKLLH